MNAQETKKAPKVCQDCGEPLDQGDEQRNYPFEAHITWEHCVNALQAHIHKLETQKADAEPTKEIKVMTASQDGALLGLWVFGYGWVLGSALLTTLPDIETRTITLKIPVKDVQP